MLHFTSDFARVEAEDFVKDVLVDRLGVAGIVFGYNARFGYRGKGDAAMLERLGRTHGFEVRVPKPVIVDGAPVSSTRIRRLIRNGELEEAARLLGRPVSLRGTVVHGDRRGHRIGFPTANLNLHHEMTPPQGVYVGRVIVDGATLWGLVNVGRRPTFYQEGRRTVEVYIEGYEGELYGRTIEVELLFFLRREMKFPSAEDLTRQIEKDRRILDGFRARESGEGGAAR